MGSIQKIQVASLEDFLCSADFESLVDAAYHYDLPCEKANQENPQIFLICKYKNNFSDEFAQSNAEGI